MDQPLMVDSHYYTPASLSTTRPSHSLCTPVAGAQTRMLNNRRATALLRRHAEPPGFAMTLARGGIQKRATPDGAWANGPGTSEGSTTFIAAASTFHGHTLLMPPAELGDWLLALGHLAW